MFVEDEPFARAVAGALAAISREFPRRPTLAGEQPAAAGGRRVLPGAQSASACEAFSVAHGRTRVRCPRQPCVGDAHVRVGCKTWQGGSPATFRRP